MRTDPRRLLHRGTAGRPALGTARASLQCAVFAGSPAGRFGSTSHPPSTSPPSTANAPVFPTSPVTRNAMLPFVLNAAPGGRCRMSHGRARNGMSPIMAVGHPGVRDPCSGLFSTEPRARYFFRHPRRQPQVMKAFVRLVRFVAKCFGGVRRPDSDARPRPWPYGVRRGSCPAGSCISRAGARMLPTIARGWPNTPKEGEK